MATSADPPYQIIVRDKNRKRVGELDALRSLKIVPRFNDVGSWELVIPKGHPKAALLTPGGWLTFLPVSGGREVASGHVRGLKEVWSASDPGAGTLTAYGPTAEVVLLDRLAYQVPSQVSTIQSASDYDRRTGPAETIIKQYVDVNGGPSAIRSRLTFGLVIEPDQGRGLTVKGSARMDVLLTLVQGLAQAGGLGFRVAFIPSTVSPTPSQPVQPDQMQLQIYVPRDLSLLARFGRELGNLVSYEYTQEAAKSSAAIVGGGGDGTARVFAEVWNTNATSAWGPRSETFVDRRDTSDSTELTQSATNETITNGTQNALSIKTMDTPNLMFGRDYYLGDTVTVVDAPVSDVLKEVEITWDASSGPSTTSTVGTKSTSGTPKILAILTALNTKVTALQVHK